MSREVGLYVDQRDDMVMKPRRPYFSSADKAVEDFLRGPHVTDGKRMLKYVSELFKS